MELIKAQTAPAVWLAAVDYLEGCAGEEDFDVILHVTDPTVLSKQDRAVYQEVDKFLTGHGAFSIHTVAETIFPLDEYMRKGATSVYTEFPSKIRAIQKGRSDSNWGSYAYRFLRQKDAHGEIFNPLKELVAKISAHGKYRASFELNAGRPLEEDIPIYDAVTDRKRLYGGPCLSHLSIKVHDGKVRLNATYRSHYYVRRLLGNLVGLGRLQYFIAKETKLQVGALTINSTFARLDAGSSDTCGKWGKRDVTALIARCRELYETEPAAA
ncbi:hypothetical protein [Bradyrhizobium sp. LA6.7]|uniref:hypothetical protein n=1 Tax=unclassified Bradyrhizobium TaxID=2631580 RepID=UPI00339AF3AD